MKLTVAAIAAIIFLGGSYLGYGKYQDTAFEKSVTPKVKEASVRITSGLRYMLKNSESSSQSSDNITTDEILNKLENDIAEIDKSALQIQSSSTTEQLSFSEPVIAYLNASLEFQRALLAKYRQAAILNTAFNIANKALNEVNETDEKYSGATYMLASKENKARIDILRDDAQKALELAGTVFKDSKLKHKNATATLLTAASNLKDKAKQITEVVPSDAIINIAVLDDVIRRNKFVVEDASVNESEKAKTVNKDGKNEAADLPPIKGKVAETMDASGYTYVRIDDGSEKELWYAIPTTKLKVGEEISIEGGSVMADFNSKTLNKFFKRIVFATRVSR